MRKLLFILTSLLAFSFIHAQSGYWYEDKFINLSIEKLDSTCFLMTANDDESQLLEKKISESKGKVTILSKIDKRQYIIKSVGNHRFEGIYCSPKYRSSKNTCSYILPQISLSTCDASIIEEILKKHRGILSVETKIDSIYRLNCNVSSSENVLKIVMDISKNANVLWCEPNRLSENKVFDNPLYPYQYYLKNSQLYPDINVESAWNIVNVDNNIKVAVIDTGVDANHEDLGVNVLEGYTVGYPSSLGSPVNVSEYNDKSHGTACAGIIAAIDNNIGIRGIASGVKILPVNIFTGYANYYNAPVSVGNSQIADAIRWAVNNNADILSCSWGGGNESNEIKYAILHAINNGRNGKGCVVVFASGNKYPEEENVAFPANVTGALAVGGIDREGTICSYSQRGANLDLVAFGGYSDIYTTTISGIGYNAGNYMSNFDGTSAACPQVAGVAALILSANPNLNGSTVNSILKNTAVDLGAAGRDNTYGYGLVDAHAAVASAITSAFRILGPSVVCNNSQYSLDHLPSGYSVTWSVYNYVSAFLNKTITSPNLYTLSRKYTDIDNARGQVVATLYYNGLLVGTITKDICVMSPTNFPGIYSQEACMFHGVSHPAITNTPLSRNAYHFVHQGCTVTLKSDFFKYMDFQWLSAVPDDIYYNGDNIITFSLPYMSGGIPFCLRLTAKDGESCSDCDLIFMSNGNGNLTSGLLVTSLNGTVFNVSILDDLNRNVKVEKISKKNSADDMEWDLFVFSIKTGNLIYKNHVVGIDTTFDTSGWNSGVYLLKGVLNGVEHINKIIVK